MRPRGSRAGLSSEERLRLKELERENRELRRANEILRKASAYLVYLRQTTPPPFASYDNALAESIIGLYKTELIARRGPWRHCEAVEFVTLHWVHWYNHRRLFGPLGHVPPAAFKAHYDHQLHESAMAA